MLNISNPMDMLGGTGSGISDIIGSLPTPTDLLPGGGGVSVDLHLPGLPGLPGLPELPSPGDAIDSVFGGRERDKLIRSRELRRAGREDIAAG